MIKTKRKTIKLINKKLCNLARKIKEKNQS